MIEKLECSCIEAYTARKMRDPNCCACSCEHNDLVEQLAKANERVRELEKKLETQMTNDFVTITDQAKRIAELESAINNQLIIHALSTEGSPEDKLSRLLDVACSWAIDPDVSENARKFAIEKKIEALSKFKPISGAVANHWCDKEQAGYFWLHSEILAEIKRLEQLLKEQK